MISSLKRLGDNVLSTRTIRVVAVAALLSTGILTSGLVNVTAPAAAKPKLVVTPSNGPHEPQDRHRVGHGIQAQGRGLHHGVSGQREGRGRL